MSKRANVQQRDDHRRHAGPGRADTTTGEPIPERARLFDTHIHVRHSTAGGAISASVECRWDDGRRFWLSVEHVDAEWVFDAQGRLRLVQLTYLDADEAARPAPAPPADGRS